jgi:hypothetical protein
MRMSRTLFEAVVTSFGDLVAARPGQRGEETLAEDGIGQAAKEPLPEASQSLATL